MEQQALVESGSRELQAAEQPKSMMEIVARAAADPRIDVAKMQALLDMQERVERRMAEVEFNQALARLMPRLPRIEKDGVIKDNKGQIRSTFAKYETIDEIIRPLLAEEGFAITFTTDDSTAKQIKIIGTLRHRMGHSLPSSVTLPTESAVIQGAQAIGATVSYGKRYVVCDLLNIVTKDQDRDGHNPQTITDDQAMTIETLIQDTKADMRRFLEYMGVNSVKEILVKDYQRAIQGLQAKARKQ